MEFPHEIGNGVTIHAVRNPVWGDRSMSYINCEIAVSGSVFGDGEIIPFTSMPTDSMEHGRELFEQLKGSAKPWVRPDVTKEDLQAEFDSIWPDVALGIADAETVELAKNLRIQIKAMS